MIPSKPASRFEIRDETLPWELPFEEPAAPAEPAPDPDAGAPEAGLASPAPRAGAMRLPRRRPQFAIRDEELPWDAPEASFALPAHRPLLSGRRMLLAAALGMVLVLLVLRLSGLGGGDPAEPTRPEVGSAPQSAPTAAAASEDAADAAAERERARADRARERRQAARARRRAAERRRRTAARERRRAARKRRRAAAAAPRAAPATPPAPAPAAPAPTAAPAPAAPALPASAPAPVSPPSDEFGLEP